MPLSPRGGSSQHCVTKWDILNNQTRLMPPEPSERRGPGKPPILLLGLMHEASLGSAGGQGS